MCCDALPCDALPAVRCDIRLYVYALDVPPPISPMKVFQERTFSSFAYEKAWRRCVLGCPSFLACYDRLLEEVICPRLRHSRASRRFRSFTLAAAGQTARAAAEAEAGAEPEDQNQRQEPAAGDNEAAAQQHQLQHSKWGPAEVVAAAAAARARTATAIFEQ